MRESTIIVIRPTSLGALAAVLATRKRLDCCESSPRLQFFEVPFRLLPEMRKSDALESWLMVHQGI